MKQLTRGQIIDLIEAEARDLIKIPTMLEPNQAAWLECLKHLLREIYIAEGNTEASEWLDL